MASGTQPRSTLLPARQEGRDLGMLTSPSPTSYRVIGAASQFGICASLVLDGSRLQ